MVKVSYDWLELDDNASVPTDVDTSRGGLAIVNDVLYAYLNGSWAVVLSTSSSTTTTMTTTITTTTTTTSSSTSTSSSTTAT